MTPPGCARRAPRIDAARGRARCRCSRMSSWRRPCGPARSCASATTTAATCRTAPTRWRARSRVPRRVRQDAERAHRPVRRGACCRWCRPTSTTRARSRSSSADARRTCRSSRRSSTSRATRSSTTSPPATGSGARASGRSASRSTRSAPLGPWVVTPDEVARPARPARRGRARRRRHRLAEHVDHDLLHGLRRALSQHGHDARARETSSPPGTPQKLPDAQSRPPVARARRRGHGARRRHRRTHDRVRELRPEARHDPRFVPAGRPGRARHGLEPRTRPGARHSRSPRRAPTSRCSTAATRARPHPVRARSAAACTPIQRDFASATSRGPLRRGHRGDRRARCASTSW